MTALTERLVFGTARLAGGAYAGQSRQMIETCIKAGIVKFDTAPGYGMGASEALLGQVTCGLDGISLHTKVGSLRPSAPALRGWAKRLRNLAPNAAASERLDGEIRIFEHVPASLDFSPDGIVRSLDRSCELLRRDRLDLVLLHEAEPQLIDPDAWAALHSAQQQGRIDRLGFAHNGPPRNLDPALVGQCAPRPEDFLGDRPGQRRIFHSIRRSLRSAMRQDAAVAAAAALVCQRNRLKIENGAHEYLVGLLLLAQSSPDAGLIFATSQPKNLASFLDLLKQDELAA